MLCDVTTRESDQARKIYANAGRRGQLDSAPGAGDTDTDTDTDSEVCGFCSGESAALSCRRHRHGEAACTDTSMAALAAALVLLPSSPRRGHI